MSLPDQLRSKNKNSTGYLIWLAIQIFSWNKSKVYLLKSMFVNKNYNDQNENEGMVQAMV
jgi:hypothetical protein